MTEEIPRDPGEDRISRDLCTETAPKNENVLTVRSSFGQDPLPVKAQDSRGEDQQTDDKGNNHFNRGRPFLPFFLNPSKAFDIMVDRHSVLQEKSSNRQRGYSTAQNILSGPDNVLGCNHSNNKECRSRQNGESKHVAHPPFYIILIYNIISIL
jgi:hypothetical protein